MVKIKHNSTNNYFNENQDTTELKQRRYVTMDTNDDNENQDTTELKQRRYVTMDTNDDNEVPN